jgi:hypothetical protein
MKPLLDVLIILDALEKEGASLLHRRSSIKRLPR